MIRRLPPGDGTNKPRRRLPVGARLTYHITDEHGTLSGEGVVIDYVYRLGLHSQPQYYLVTSAVDLELVRPDEILTICWD